MYRVFEMSNLGSFSTAHPPDCDHIDTPIPIQFRMCLQVSLGRFQQVLALFGGYRRLRRAERRSMARFDLHEHRNPPGLSLLASYQINLTIRRAHIAFQDRVTLLLQVSSRQALSPIPKRFSPVTHLTHRSRKRLQRALKLCLRSPVLNTTLV
jgi:hypothetical protein